jgi:hypothetical protein
LVGEVDATVNLLGAEMFTGTPKLPSIETESNRNVAETA